MSTRTPEELKQDAEASALAQSLIDTLIRMRVNPTVGANALAGALGAYVAMAAESDTARQMMRLMATQAHEQMEQQLKINRAEASGVVGHA